MTEPTFQQHLWADFTAQWPEPDDLTLRYGGAGPGHRAVSHRLQWGGDVGLCAPTARTRSGQDRGDNHRPGAVERRDLAFGGHTGLRSIRSARL